MPNNPPSAPVVLLRDVSKRFSLQRQRATSVKDLALGLLQPSRREPREELWALRRVSLSIGEGEAVAFIGRNGSGKSTLLRLVAGILTPTYGTVGIRRGARVGTMIELGIGFHGELTARENVYLNAAVHGLDRRSIDAVYADIVAYSGLAHFMEQPVKQFSSGMTMRLGFSVAVTLRPDLLLLDEVFAVGDADFQRQCLDTMQDFRARGGTLLFVSHAPEAIRRICDRAVVLDAGRVVFDGSVDDGLQRYTELLAEPRAPLPGAAERDAAAEWHRTAMGPHWADLGAWADEVLTAEGLRPEAFLLDAGCGSLPVAQRLLPRMAPGHYWGLDTDHELFAAGVRHELEARGLDPTRGHFLINRTFSLEGAPAAFDLILVHSWLSRLTPDQARDMLLAVAGRLAPRGRCLVALGGDAGARALVASVAATLGVTCAERPGARHPSGEPVVALERPA